MVLQCSPTLSQERLCCLSNCSTDAKIVCHVCNISMSGKLFCAQALQTLFPPLRQLANQAVGVVTKPFERLRAALALYARRVTGTPFQHLNIFYLSLLLICRLNPGLPRESSIWSAPRRGAIFAGGKRHEEPGGIVPEIVLGMI